MEVNLRGIALKRALELNATTTGNLIRDIGQPLTAVLKSAINELGVETVVYEVLSMNNPSYALVTLGLFRELRLDDYPGKKDLIVMANKITPSLVSSGLIQPRTEEIKLVDKISLNLKAVVGYAANFTMFWWNEGRWLPPEDSKSSQWHWSKHLNVGQGQTIDCIDFAINDWQLNPNDIINMQLDICCDSTIYAVPVKTTQIVKYSPNANNTFHVDAKGSVNSPSFSVSFPSN